MRYVLRRPETDEDRRAREEAEALWREGERRMEAAARQCLGGGGSGRDSKRGAVAGRHPGPS